MVCAVGLFGLPATARGAAPIQGMTLAPAQNGGFTDPLESILNMRQVGVNTVALEITWQQSTPQASMLSGPSVQSLAQVVDALRNNGMQVVLKPNVAVKTGQSAALIEPADTQAWFASYGEFIGSVADFAQEQHVQLLSIGEELNTLEEPRFDPLWRDLIANVRARYHGNLTYAAAHAADHQVGGGYAAVPWWNELDYVGVNAFFRIASDFNADATQLRSGWRKWADELEAWWVRSRLDRPIIFTKAGYQSADGAAFFPDGKGIFDTDIDLREQADAYAALLGTLRDRPWWDGVLWSDWNADPDAGGPGDDGFTPQHKLAEAVLAEYYGGETTFFVLPSLLASWDESFDDWRDPSALANDPGELSLEHAAGVTLGTSSLRLPSVAGTALTSASKIWTVRGSNAFTLFQLAAANIDKFVIEFDATFEVDQMPADPQTTMLLSLEDHFQGLTDASLDVHLSGDASLTVELSIPLAELGPLDPASLFYELQIGTANNWSGSVLLDNLRLRSTVPGDITNDVRVDRHDIDALSDAIVDGNSDEQFDVNGDGLVNAADRDAWVAAVGTLYGDTNLNGVVEFADFLELADGFGFPGGWDKGDSTGDRFVNFADFLLLSRDFGQTVPHAENVPEPGGGVILLLLASCCLRPRQRNGG